MCLHGIIQTGNYEEGFVWKFHYPELVIVQGTQIDIFNVAEENEKNVNKIEDSLILVIFF